MLKKKLAVLSVLLSALFVFGGAARAQQTESAAESRLFQVMLPVKAERVAPDSVPGEISGVLDKIIEASAGKFTKGDTEVLVWSGAGYKKANAPAIVSRLTGVLKDAGWQYEPKGEEGGVSFFIATQDSPRSRSVVGFHTANDQGLVFTAMELMPVNGASSTAAQTDDNAAADNQNEPAADVQPAKNPALGGSIVGKWYDGYVSLVGVTPTVGPKSYTPGRSHRFEYTFNPNGTYTYTGIMQNTIYSCTTTIFNDQRGTYKVSGGKITMTMTKNFFRRTDTCSAANFMERNHTLSTDTYDFSISRNDRGKAQICFNDGKTNVCYERE